MWKTYVTSRTLLSAHCTKNVNKVHHNNLIMILPGIATPQLTFFSSLRKTLAYGFKTHQHCIFFLIFECCVVWYQFVISLFSMSTLLQMIYDDIWSKSFHFKEKEVFCVLSDNHYHAMPGSDFSKWNKKICVTLKMV